MGPDGLLYFAQQGYYISGRTWSGHNVFRINALGRLEHVVGGSEGNFSNCRSDIPAVHSLSCFGLLTRIDVASDGTLFLVDKHYWDGQRAAYGNGIIRVKPQLPGFTNDVIVFPSSDGSEHFVFNASGRHLRTTSTLTGATRYAFEYDANGRLTAITDPAGETTFERNTAGQLTALISPYAERTELTLDAHGYLASVRDPTDRLTMLDHGPTGLLRQITDARSGAYAFEYDDLGRVTSTEDAGEASHSLVRTPVTNDTGQAIGHQVVRTGPEERAKTYRFVQQPSGVAEYSVLPAGLT
jgi:YD repeat-containing protein